MDEQSSLYTALAVTLDGIADADERQQVREYIKQLEAERAELRAKLTTTTKRAEIAEYQRNRALSYADHCYNAGYIGAGRIPWELYLRV